MLIHLFLKPGGNIGLAWMDYVSSVWTLKSEKLQTLKCAPLDYRTTFLQFSTNVLL